MRNMERVQTWPALPAVLCSRFILKTRSDTKDMHSDAGAERAMTSIFPARDHITVVAAAEGQGSHHLRETRSPRNTNGLGGDPGGARITKNRI